MGCSGPCLVLGVVVPTDRLSVITFCGVVGCAGGVDGSLICWLEPRGISVGVLWCSEVLHPKRSGAFVRHLILRGGCALEVIQLAGSGVLLRHRLRFGSEPCVSPCWHSVGSGWMVWFAGSFCMSLCVCRGGSRLVWWFAAILIQESPSVVFEKVRFRPVKMCGLR